MNKIKHILNTVIVCVIIFVIAFLVAGGSIFFYEFIINDASINPTAIVHSVKAGLFVAGVFVIVLIFSFKEI